MPYKKRTPTHLAFNYHSFASRIVMNVTVTMPYTIIYIVSSVVIYIFI